MIRRITLLVLAAIVFVGAVFAIKKIGEPALAPMSSESSSTQPQIKQFELLTDETESPDVARQVLLSSPLVVFGKGSSTPFTPAQVIVETNQQRTMNGVTPLTENAKLDAAAQLKVQDLFENQYFDHVSPITGKGPDALDEEVGYQYVSIGENLALGDFGDEASLVAAWMASPGHRANILRPQFQEIGVAVGRGTYQGRQVLIAVQEFGRPLNSCPTVDAMIKASINTEKTQLSTLGDTLASLKSQIDIYAKSTSTDEASYDSAVNMYNTQVTSYNALVAAIKQQTNVYNGQVQAFNACLAAST